MWLHFQVAIPWGGRCEAPHDTVQPVGHSSQGVVIERGHLAGIDRAVRKEAVPALPDGCRSHRYRIEPRRAFTLREQVVSDVNLPNTAQSVTDQGCPHEAGADVVSTFAY